MLPKQSYKFYNATIPSTKKQIKFRPFTVREEKQLVVAQESEDMPTIINVIQEVLSACIQDSVDVKSLAIFDVEYLMTQIRSKSVGEVVNLSMPCANDPTHEKIPVRIDLSRIAVTFDPAHKNTIPLFDDVGVKMKYPTLDMLPAMETADPFEVAILCTEFIYDSEEIHQAAEQTKEELREFFETLDTPQFKKIEDQFFATMPVYEYELEYTCPQCKHVHKRVIKGLSNFFA